MKKLIKKDLQVMLDYATKNYYQNIVLISNLTKNGVDDTKQLYYGTFNDQDELVNLVMNDFSDRHLRIYGDEFNKKDLDFITKLLGEENYEYVTVQKKWMETLEPALKTVKLGFANIELVSFDKADVKREPIETFVELANSNDVNALIQLSKDVFGKNSQIWSYEEWSTDLANEDKLTYIIRQGNDIAAMATVGNITDFAALISKIATSRNYRKRGYAFSIISKIAQDFSGYGLNLAIFCDNPAAVHVYKKVGFVEVEEFMFGKLIKK